MNTTQRTRAINHRRSGRSFPRWNPPPPTDPWGGIRAEFAPTARSLPDDFADELRQAFRCVRCSGSGTALAKPGFHGSRGPCAVCQGRGTLADVKAPVGGRLGALVVASFFTPTVLFTVLPPRKSPSLAVIVANTACLTCGWDTSASTSGTTLAQTARCSAHANPALPPDPNDPFQLVRYPRNREVLTKVDYRVVCNQISLESGGVKVREAVCEPVYPTTGFGPSVRQQPVVRVTNSKGVTDDLPLGLAMYLGD